MCMTLSPTLTLVIWKYGILLSRFLIIYVVSFDEFQIVILYFIHFVLTETFLFSIEIKKEMFCELGELVNKVDRVY